MYRIQISLFLWNIKYITVVGQSGYIFFLSFFFGKDYHYLY